MSGERDVEQLLRRRQPTLAPVSEARIRRELMARAAREQRPARLALLIAIYLFCGLLLLGLAAAGAAGVGPLAF